MALLQEELSYKLVGCFYGVRNKYGFGHKEGVYDKALAEELAATKLSFVAKPRIDIYSLISGKKIGIYIPDYLVANLIIVEIKALPYTPKDAILQLGQYLKISNFEIAYLVNFCEINFKPERFIYTNDRKPFLIDRRRMDTDG